MRTNCLGWSRGPSMEGLLEALPRLARDAAVGVIVPAWWGVAQGPYDVARRRASCAPLSWASTNSARRPQTNAHLTLLPFELILGRTSLDDRMTDTVRKLTGEAPMNMRDFVKLHAAEFKERGPAHS